MSSKIVRGVGAGGERRAGYNGREAKVHYHVSLRTSGVASVGSTCSSAISCSTAAVRGCLERPDET